MKKNILIVGLGNPLLGDEGVGVEVIQRMFKMKLPDSVEVADGGTGGLKLLHLFENRERIIIIDCANFGGIAGEVKVFTPDKIRREKGEQITLHNLDLKGVLDLGEKIGIKPDITIVGIQPKTMEFKNKLSDCVSESITEVIKIIAEMIAS